MISPQHTQESLSIAFATAIAGEAGVNFKVHGGFDYGVDGAFHEVQYVNRRRTETGISIDCQLKSSIQWEFDGEDVVYDLEAKNYNDLIDRSSRPRATPLLLGLLCLPKSRDCWLSLSETQLILKNCCYWTRLEGQRTNNKNTMRIRIPRTRLLNPEAVTGWFNNVTLGVW